MRVYTLCAGNANVCTKTLLDSRTNEWYTSPMKYKDRAMRADATLQRDALAFLETHGRARPVDVHRALPQYSAPLIVATLAALAKRGFITRVERGVYALPGLSDEQSAIVRGDMALLRILVNAVENAPAERQAELLSDLRIAQTQRDRSAMMYAGLAELVRRLEAKIAEGVTMQQK